MTVGFTSLPRAASGDSEGRRGQGNAEEEEESPRIREGVLENTQVWLENVEGCVAVCRRHSTCCWGPALKFLYSDFRCLFELPKVYIVCWSVDRQPGTKGFTGFGGSTSHQTENSLICKSCLE